MSELQCVARLKIHDGKLDEFKRLAAKCAELVRTKDTGLCSTSCTSTATTPSVLSLSGTATRRPSWIITRIWGHNGRDSSDMLWVWRNMRKAAKGLRESLHWGVAWSWFQLGQLGYTPARWILVPAVRGDSHPRAFSLW
jgi:hypothetical protein